MLLTNISLGEWSSSDLPALADSRVITASMQRQHKLTAYFYAVHDMLATGLARFPWPAIFRPLHDALLEDALSQAQSSLRLTPAASPWSAHVRLLRWLMTGGKAKPQGTPNPSENPDAVR